MPWSYPILRVDSEAFPEGSASEPRPHPKHGDILIAWGPWRSQ